jgi:hypothetical protein
MCWLEVLVVALRGTRIVDSFYPRTSVTHSIRFFVAPLDVVKIRFQLQMHPSIQAQERPDYFYRSISDAFVTIYQKEGVRVRDRRADEIFLLFSLMLCFHLPLMLLCAMLTRQGLWKGNLIAEVMWVSHMARML